MLPKNSTGLLSLSNVVVLVLSALVLSACNGPEVRTCLSRPQWGGFECHDARGDKDYHLPVTQAGGYRCKSLADESDILAYCEAEKCLKELEYTRCVVRASLIAFDCTRPDGSRFQMPFEETENYVCRPPEDEDTVIDYCNAKAGCL